MTGPGAFLAIVLYTLPGFVIGSLIHELSHAAIALRCGDPTPRRDGRMTLDPRRNIDALGSAALLIAGVGWGRPVALDPLYLRDTRSRAAIAAMVIAALLPAELTHGGINPVDAMTVGLAAVTFDHLVVPGVDAIFLGLPNVFSVIP